MSVVIAQINLLLVWAILQGSPGIQSLVEGTLRLDPTLIATAMTTLLILIFGEILAKTIFRVRAAPAGQDGGTVRQHHDRFLEIASAAGHSRIPVYRGRVYDIVGIVNLLDVVYSGGGEPASGPTGRRTIEPFIRRDLLFVPESKPSMGLLTQIRGSRHSMAFVVDEYGGVVGLVTVEDLVEEIVGDVSDERDPPDYVRLIGPRTLECEGRAEVDRLAEEFALPIPPGNYETISGYVLHRMLVIPKPGDQVEVDGQFTITISEADSRGIQRLRIQSLGSDFRRHSG